MKSRFGPPKEESSTYPAVSAHPSNTTAKRRDAGKRLLGQLSKVSEENYADIIASDFNSSAYRERGKARVCSVEETWERTPLIPPRDLAPMWGQMEYS